MRLVRKSLCRNWHSSPASSYIGKNSDENAEQGCAPLRRSTGSARPHLPTQMGHRPWSYPHRRSSQIAFFPSKFVSFMSVLTFPSNYLRHFVSSTVLRHIRATITYIRIWSTFHVFSWHANSLQRISIDFYFIIWWKGNNAYRHSGHSRPQIGLKSRRPYKSDGQHIDN